MMKFSVLEITVHLDVHIVKMSRINVLVLHHIFLIVELKLKRVKMLVLLLLSVIGLMVSVIILSVLF